jgi:hypothetical protein
MVTYNDAKKLVDMGLNVIPLNEKTKIPALSSWEEYQHRMVKDEELHKWFDDSKKNIAVICGKVSGNLVVIDFDNLDILPFLKDIPILQEKTIIVRTGKGLHIYFRVDEKYTQTRKFENLKVDIKGEGGYVVAPPSVHPSGAIYQFHSETDIKFNEKIGELLEYLEEKDQEAKYLWKIIPYWHQGVRNRLIVGLTVFFKIKLNWNIDKITEFLKGINRMRPDPQAPYNEKSIEKEIKEAYEKEYNYQKFLDDELILDLNKILPKDANVLWRLTLQDNKDLRKEIVCTKKGVKIEKIAIKDKQESVVSTIPIFSQPLILANAWKLTDGLETDIKFLMLLGDYSYIGTKDEIAKEITDKAVTGINITYIKEAVNACVEYYISTKTVEIKSAFGAIGVYEENDKFIIVLPGQPEYPLNTVPNTEPWFVEKDFTMKQKIDIKTILETYNKLPNFFSEKTLIIFFGLSIFFPFAYSLKAKGNIVIPLLIIKGATGTGKTSLSTLFIVKMYGIKDGGPSDVTSDYRLLDFITGTTFPRMVDESENAKFKGNRFQKGVEATLKDASERQLVGKRGTPERKKDLYMARSPLILVGNKIDLTDPAVLTRSIILNFGVEKKVKKTELRKKFREEVQNILDESKGWGVHFINFIIDNIKNTNELYDIINNLRNRWDVNYTDARRADFYAEIYFGLTMWKHIMENYGIEFSLAKYLNDDKFKEFIIETESVSKEENEERQEIIGFIDYIRTQWAIRQEIWENTNKTSEYSHIPETISIIDQKIKFDNDDHGKWIYFTQTAVTDYAKENKDFPYKTLAEVTDAIAEFYGQKNEVFYPKKAIWIGKRACKAGRIPADSDFQPSMDNYVDNDHGPPPEDPNQRLGVVRFSVRPLGLVYDVVWGDPNQPNQKNDNFSYSDLDQNQSEKNANSSVRSVRNNIQDNKLLVENEENNKKENLTKDLTKPNQPNQNEDDLISILVKKDFNYKFGDNELHCTKNDILKIEYKYGQEIIDKNWGRDFEQ